MQGGFLAIELLDKPKHVVVVMDGNGRWAKSRGAARFKGHLAGAKTAKSIISHASSLGIRCLSLFAFSSENWMRPKKEVTFLLDLVIKTLSNEMAELHQNNVKLIFTGSRLEFSNTFCRTLEKAEILTQHNEGMILNVVINYGGRWDVLQATKKLMHKCQNENLLIDNLTEEMFSNELCIADLPEPDLFIRTSGEYRLSNFFLWQMAYAELYFTPTLWPDFTCEELDRAIDWFCNRERRFGQTSEQLTVQGSIHA